MRAHHLARVAPAPADHRLARVDRLQDPVVLPLAPAVLLMDQSTARDLRVVLHRPTTRLLINGRAASRLRDRAIGGAN